MEQQEFQISTMGFLQMQDKIETQKGENKILRQKLQSKAEALLIITKELEKVRGECDEYRELVQRLQQSQCSISKTFAHEDTLETLEALSSLPVGVNMKVVAVSDSTDSFNSRAFRDQSVASRFSALRNENKRLLLERENVKRILNEREEDIRLLRMQTRKEKQQRNEYRSPKEVVNNSINNIRLGQKLCHSKSICPNESTNTGCGCGNHSNEDIVRQLEILQMKYDKLKHDFQVCYESVFSCLIVGLYPRRTTNKLFLLIYNALFH
jgi:chromosome segregation ATPase